MYRMKCTVGVIGAEPTTGRGLGHLFARTVIRTCTDLVTSDFSPRPEYDLHEVQIETPLICFQDLPTYRSTAGVEP